MKIYTAVVPLLKKGISKYIYILGKNLFNRYSLVESGESSKTFLPWASYFVGVIWRNLSFFLLTGRGINIYIKRDRKKWRGKKEVGYWRRKRESSVSNNLPPFEKFVSASRSIHPSSLLLRPGPSACLATCATWNSFLHRSSDRDFTRESIYPDTLINSNDFHEFKGLLLLFWYRKINK